MLLSLTRCLIFLELVCCDLDLADAMASRSVSIVWIILRLPENDAHDPKLSCTMRRICDAATERVRRPSMRDTLHSPSSSRCDEERMKRRAFIAGTAGLLALPRHLRAQEKRYRLGFLAVGDG